ncbi:MAG: transcription termination/antitermination protein NusG [Opitutales bacterium]|nr:transcription termination/antitermination protein NusG [Opitutales bacterium]
MADEETNNAEVTTWYTLQTLVNAEQKAKTTLEKNIKSEGFENDIKEILMPTETIQDLRNGKKTKRTRKLYPGYLFIRMRCYNADGELNVAPWMFVRNTDGVIDFLGHNHPVQMTTEEMENVFKVMREAEGKFKPSKSFTVGETVKILEGAFMNMEGVVTAVDNSHQKLTVSVDFFERMTPVTIEFLQAQHVKNV